jgi:hypothetical protein
MEKTEKSENFVQKPDLLKKNPAENACAFGQTGIYTHLCKIIEIYRKIMFFLSFSGAF